MHEMFISEIFNRFQVKQIDKMNAIIIGLISQGKYEQADGAMKIAKALVRLPSTISDTDDVKQRISENMKLFQSNFIREAVKE